MNGTPQVAKGLGQYAIGLGVLFVGVAVAAYAAGRYYERGKAGEKIIG